MSADQNHLIESLPRADRKRLLAICEPVQLVLSEVLCDKGQPTRHAYFPVDGFISLVECIDQRAGLEVGMVGREGMLGVQLALGVTHEPLRALVQGAGTAWRVGRVAFGRELTRNVALRRALDRYLAVSVLQMATSVACQCFHQIGPRLARWLLMSQDRAHANRFHVTHDVLACMLGVRRVGITTAAVALQRAGLIEYHRGELTVLDRVGLEASACSCYATDCQTYADTMQRSIRPSPRAPA